MMASSMGLSGGRYLDPHSDSGFHYKYFPMDTEYKYVMVEDLILWNHGGFGSRLVKSPAKYSNYPNAFTNSIIIIKGK